jgi:hypothetical protein
VHSSYGNGSELGPWSVQEKIADSRVQSDLTAIDGVGKQLAGQRLRDRTNLKACLGLRVDDGEFDVRRGAEIDQRGGASRPLPGKCDQVGREFPIILAVRASYPTRPFSAGADIMECEVEEGGRGRSRRGVIGRR